jgi:hypothetical protein
LHHDHSGSHDIDKLPVQVVELVGLTGGFLDGVPPEGVREALERARAAVQRDCPQVRMTLNHLPGKTPSHISRPLIACIRIACPLLPRIFQACVQLA